MQGVDRFFLICTTGNAKNMDFGFRIRLHQNTIGPVINAHFCLSSRKGKRLNIVRFSIPTGQAKNWAKRGARSLGSAYMKLLGMTSDEVRLTKDGIASRNLI